MGHSRVISVVEFAIVGIVVAFVVHWGGRTPPNIVSKDVAHDLAEFAL